MTTLAALAAAIALSQPHAPQSTLRYYAFRTYVEAKAHHIDPFLIVAIVDNESHWMAGAISDTENQCVGLGQICLSNFPECQAEVMSEKCMARAVSLTDPAVNLRMVASMLDANRTYCKRTTGHAAERHYLAAYQGIGGSTCGQVKVRGRWRDAPMHRLTRKVLAYRGRIVRRR